MPTLNQQRTAQRVLSIMPNAKVSFEKNGDLNIKSSREVIGKDKAVYVVKAGGFYKIGISNNVQERIKSIQTGNHQKVKFQMSVLVNDAHKLERKLHAKFASKRVKGEWFSLNESEVYWIFHYFINLLNNENADN